MKLLTTGIVTLVMILYAVIGGVVFQLLEKDQETAIRHDVHRQLDTFLGTVASPLYAIRCRR